MQHSRFLTTLTPETLNLIHQLPIADANDIGKLSETFDLVSLMLDTGATEHEIWQSIALVNENCELPNLDVSEALDFMCAQKLLQSPKSHTIDDKESVLFVVAAVATTRAKKFCEGLQRGGHALSSLYNDEFEHLSLYAPIVEKTRLFDRYLAYLRNALPFCTLEPTLFQKYRQIYVSEIKDNECDDLAKIVRIADAAAIEIAFDGQKVYFTELIRDEEILEGLMTQLQAHFPDVHISRSKHQYIDFHWTRKHFNRYFKGPIFLCDAIRNGLKIGCPLDVVALHFKNLLH